jgi:GT2 family glycosyltransferase
MISVLIVTWNRQKQLKKCLNSIPSSPLISEIIVVDNNSDCSLEWVEKDYDNVKLFKLDKNYGCAVARNIGIANCKEELVYFLDDDGWIESNTIQSSYNILKLDKDTGVVVSRILSPENEDLGIQGKSRYVNSYNGGASLMRKNIFTDISFYPAYKRQMEESFISLLLFEEGIKIYFNPESIMFHEKIKTIQDSSNEVYLNIINDMNNINTLLNAPFNKVLILLKYLKYILSFKNLHIFMSITLKTLKVFFSINSKSKKVSLRSYFSFLKD